MTWHDWLNLRSLTEVSRVIALAAGKRENSRGAHFRSDFPEPGDLPSSRFTVARQTAGGLDITEEPVEFTHVRPGETLLPDKFAPEKSEATMFSISSVQRPAEELMGKAAIEIPDDYLAGLRQCADTEKGDLSAFVIKAMLENYDAAKEDRRAMCGDTGLP